MAKNDDTLSGTYQYVWSKDSDSGLSDFLKKYKPSMVQDDGTKPWIWVRGSTSPQENEDQETAIEEASTLLKEVTATIANIKNDASIPARSSKKTGAKGKKEVREEAQAEATKKLKEISIRTGYVSGKWMIFAPPDKVDLIWSTIATSLVTGPLSSTPAFLAKVSTSPQSDPTPPNFSHLICIYVPNVYDKDGVTQVMKTLVRQHGASLRGIKSNLYTSIGLDSKHPSAIQTTAWKEKDLVEDSEIKELREAYFADLKAGTTNQSVEQKLAGDDKQKGGNDGGGAGRGGGDGGVEMTAAKPKPKPVLKKKKVDDDPFASDNDDAGEGDEDAKANGKRGKELEEGGEGESPKKKQRA